MHSTDHYERQHTRPAHKHTWVKLTPQSARCECGARAGVLTEKELHPPGMSDAECAGILRGEPWIKHAPVPRLPKNWRGR